MASSSPAPWIAHGTRVSAADGSEVCDICPQDDTQVFDANRNLIVAAPDLYEALKGTMRLLAAVRYTVGFGKTQQDRIDRAAKAIDKAEGK